MKKLLFMLCIMTLCLMFTGCAQSTDVLNDAASEQSLISGDVSVTFLDLPEVWYNTCIICKRWAPVVMVGSWIIGAVILEIFRKNKEVQKWAYSVLIFKIPGFTFLFVYVYTYFYGVFNL